MDRLKRSRKPLRSAITRIIHEVENELAQEVPDHVVLRVKLQMLEAKLTETVELDQQIMDILLDNDVPDEEFEAESISIDEYKQKVLTAKVKTEKVISPPVRPGSPTPTTYSTAVSDGEKRRNFKLPKIELRKFNGELTEWLGFWSQFQKIDEDEGLHATDKYQYLIQSMVKGTRARDLVISYPQTAENYPKVIEALKDRFGRKKLLKQVYVRELLKLAMSNTISGEKVRAAQLYDKLESNLRALESLGVTPEQTSEFLYPMVESSLKEDVLIAWQRSSLNGLDGSKENPPKNEMDYLMQFLRKEVENEDQRALVQTGFASTKDKKKVRGNEESGRSTKHNSWLYEGAEDDVPTVAGLHVGEKAKCMFCDKQHESQKCWKAASMSFEDKKAVLQKRKCCLVCLKPGHFAKNCKSWERCLICNQKHSVIMCPDFKKKEDNSSSTRGGKIENVLQNVACTSRVILGTLKTTIKHNGRDAKVRIFYDIGSQRNYILKKVADHLELKPVGEEKLSHSLFGGIQTGVERHNVFQVKIPNVIGEGLTTVRVLDKDKICGQIPRMSYGPWMTELKKQGIWISDIGQDSDAVDILIGADMFAKLLTGRKYQLENGLTALETLLGWILMGEYQDPHNFGSDSLAMTVVSMQVADFNVEDLWNLETIGIKDPIESLSKENRDKEVREHFLKTVTKSDGGRYSVSLPWTNGRQKIPDHRNVAEQRLESTTRTLKMKGKFHEYQKIFDSWLEEDMIEIVHEQEVDSPSHYLPHRAVFKPESQTTPIRPVFDASHKNKKNRTPSLNDCLEKGPNTMELLPSVLLRFRMKLVGFVSGIRKAFQMIEVNVEDRDYLRFLWWEDPTNKKFKVYRHKRVVFGVNCSPYLLAAVIEFHLGQVDPDRKPLAEKLLKSLYVDNCVMSVDSQEEYEEFKDQATQLMKEAFMDLRLWQCNSEEDSGVGSRISAECGLETSRVAKDEFCTSVLGLNWDRRKDTLSSDFELVVCIQKLTKREVLSCVQKIFDPLGFLSPALLYPKLLLQEAWGLKMNWDDELPQDVKEKFLAWYAECDDLKEIKVPRNASGGATLNSKWELHTFCDASKDAYAAAVFLRTETDGKVSVQLLQSKARVAPLNLKHTEEQLKRASIPRLELMGCTIAARLTDAVKKAMELDTIPTYYWCDSSTALAWIRRNDEWGTFVGNRVREILKLSQPQNWNHVPGIINPADLPSRGCNPKELLISRWWEGPGWLMKSREAWPVVQEPPVDEDEINAERKKGTITMIASSTETPWYARKSSFYGNVRKVAWLTRFGAYLCKDHSNTGWLSVNEIQAAEYLLFKFVQDEVFPKNQEIISGIRVSRHLEDAERLKVSSVMPNGMIYVKTKLIYRNDAVGFRFPILLPSSHVLVDQLIEETHKIHGHAGVQFLMGKLREKYWILQGRRTIRNVIRRCTTCRRFSTKKSEVVPAPLPEARVQTSKVFETVGVDLAGPLILKDKKKVWILLVTCAVYRCVHLEIVESLSTEDFLNAFSRFCNFRGRPTSVYSDNGTNFVGAVTAFKTVDWDRVTRYCGLKMIQWKFNPPSAAWWGGWWERLIRSVKDVLRKILGNAKVTEGKLRQYLTDVTSIINSRPLTTVTEDPDDLIPLTPSMFMYDIPMVDYSDLDILCEIDFRDAYRQRRLILDQFKSRFRKEYLSQLVQRQKERKIVDLRLGDVVLIGDDNKKRWQWPIARVMELIRGRDGNVRVVKLRTAVGTLTRPVQRVYPLEVTCRTEVPELAIVKKIEIVDEAVTSPKKTEEYTTRFGRKVKAPVQFNH